MMIPTCEDNFRELIPVAKRLSYRGQKTEKIGVIIIVKVKWVFEELAGVQFLVVKFLLTNVDSELWDCKEIISLPPKSSVLEINFRWVTAGILGIKAKINCQLLVFLSTKSRRVSFLGAFLFA